MSELSSNFERELSQLQEEELNLQELIAKTIVYLRKRHGVENLTLIEGVRLRHIAEKELVRHQHNLQAYNKGELSIEHFTEPVCEAAWRWLKELYSIDNEQLPSEDRGNVPPWKDRAMLDYLYRIREKSHLLVECEHNEEQ